MTAKWLWRREEVEDAMWEIGMLLQAVQVVIQGSTRFVGPAKKRHKMGNADDGPDAIRSGPRLMARFSCQLLRKRERQCCGLMRLR